MLSKWLSQKFSFPSYLYKNARKPQNVPVLEEKFKVPSCNKLAG